MTLLDRIIDTIKRDAELLRAAVENVLFGPLTDAQMDRLFTTRAAMLPEGSKLDWRHSIVDKLKVLGLDSSLAGRAELARNLGWTGKVDGSADSNIALNDALMAALRHRLVMGRPLAERE